ncbi:MAG: hypothetical protein PWR17_1069 [Candidatus Methanomethylophilaceae archaeon]|nr:hypothetical protein [Candidatus Methanomethylophilaceae archaeon]
MAIFSGKHTVFGPELMSVGDFDPRADGGYRNVVVTQIKVKPKRMLYVQVKSDNPVDVAVVDQKGRPIGHKDGVTDDTLGPISTETWTDMGFIVGLFRGDKAKALVEVWTERK